MDNTKEKLTISFYKNGIATTTLTYDEITDEVTVSERVEEVEISVGELREWIQGASVWRNEIWSLVKKPELSTNKYDVDIKKNPSSGVVELKIQVDGVNFGTKWKKNTNAMTLKVRNEVVIAPIELDFMIRHYTEFLKVIETYD
ncbi:MAG: hypothetical protein A2126_00205 [Candidatus Woykebacteria bacterium GWB1_45_5]|uniref:Uncharacterized protein n=1 Tax=Candidatus Woykebacteria bacterium GWB1_45_5 TaxID=1802592 RepID=A0A1G1W898_9BACT|nr:MAG: hypothetical protein A2126_00205 [Candidatus Woykebacteria bacterium GWB1_45_5]